MAMITELHRPESGDWQQATTTTGPLQGNLEGILGLRHGSVRWNGAVLRLRTCWVSSYEPADAKGGNTVTAAIGMPTQLDQSLSLLPCFSPSISNLSPHVLLSSLHDLINFPAASGYPPL
ncbi:hypothetical protein Peur_067545 [Populus x canadensis]